MKKLKFILGVLLCVICLNGCAKKEKIDLYNFKTPYIGDNSKVSNVVKFQHYPDDAKLDHIEIQSDEAPYQLTVILDNTDMLEPEKLFKNAVTTFALIDNLDEIFYIDETSEIARFTKAEVNEELQKQSEPTIAQIGSSSEKLNSFLEQ